MFNWHMTPSNDDILHYGVLGMKWGVRRYENVGGNLTARGKSQYLKDYTNAKNISRTATTSFLEKTISSDEMVDIGKASNLKGKLGRQYENALLNTIGSSNTYDVLYSGKKLKEILNPKDKRYKDLFKLESDFKKAEEKYSKVAKQYANDLLGEIPDNIKDIKFDKTWERDLSDYVVHLARTTPVYVKKIIEN